MIVTGAGYAKLRGKSNPWVTAKIKEGMPVSDGGVSGKRYKIDTAKAIEWELERGNGRRGKSGESERDRLVRAQADKVEAENELRAGQLMPIEAHRELLDILAAEVARQMASFPGIASELSGITDKAVLRARLMKECNEVRNAFARRLGEVAAELADIDVESLSERGVDSAGTAGPDAGRMGQEE